MEVVGDHEPDPVHASSTPRLLKAIRLTLIGPPGSGKGTQADWIASHLRVPPIHVGELLRRQVADATPMGRTIQGYLDRGDLAPDQLVTQMVLERIDQPDCADGFVLDGYPRRIGQAEALDRHLATRGTALDAACYLEVPDEEIRRRLAGRGRVDDEQVFGHRLTVFETQTRPLLAYYQERDRLVVVDAIGSVEVVTERILTGLTHLVSQTSAVDPPAGPAARSRHGAKATLSLKAGRSGRCPLARRGVALHAGRGVDGVTRLRSIAPAARRR